MAQKYQVKQGDMLDDICKRFYGDSSGFVEKVLEANPNLAAEGYFGEVLPMGMIITLPDIPVDPDEKPVQLFD